MARIIANITRAIIMLGLLRSLILDSRHEIELYIEQQQF